MTDADLGTSEPVRLIRKYYSSREGWIDGTTQFRQMIRAKISPGSRVLDLGAGAGRDYKHSFRGESVHLVGVDIAPEVLQNPWLDEAHCSDAAALPFGDGCFDVIFSDFVFEHLPEPRGAIREIYRVLKVGGYFFLRTPNRWHYVVLVASALPEFAQEILLERFTPRKSEDVFPKFYRCNTEGMVRRLFVKAGFTVEELVLVEKEPTYLTRSAWLFRAGVWYESLVTSTDRLKSCRSNILARFRKSRNNNAAPLAEFGP